MADPSALWLFVPPMSLVLGHLGRLALRRWEHRLDAPYRMRRRARVLVSEVTDGAIVRLSGRVELPEGVAPLRAPLSGRPCVAYRVEVTHNAGREGRQRLGEHSRMEAFTLRDDSGRALVDIHDDVPWLSPTELTPSSQIPPEVFRAFLRELRGSDKVRDPRFEEGVLAVGARVAVVGRVRLDPARTDEGLESGYRERGGYPVIEAADDEGVLVSNLPLVLR